MTAEPLELAGILAACGSVAIALVDRDPRRRALALALALVVAPALVLGSVWDEPRVEDFRASPARVVAGLAAGLIALAVAFGAFRRRFEWFAIAAAALLPIRVPIEIGGETANLLVPLYVVIAAALLVRAWGMRGGEPIEGGPRRWDHGWPWRVRILLAASLVLYAIQSAYSEDVSNAIENAGFFLVPFAAMFALLLDVEWTRGLLAKVVTAVGVVALACAAIAIGQFAARDLFLNEELLDANQLHQYFRVNSVFFDPNILGRYLALAITLLAACLAWNGSRARVVLLAAVCAVCVAALAFSYSITSFGALLLGLGLIAVLRWRWRGLVAAGALAAVGLAALAIAGGTPSSDIESDRYFDSGRESLLEGGLELFGDRRAAGWGSGGFGQAFFDRIERARTTVSHSEPVTVAAEQGVIGLIPYVLLIAAILVTLLGAAAGSSLARTAIAAAFVVMLVHSLGYASFLSDPATWMLLALGVALRAAVDRPTTATTSAAPSPAPATSA